MHNIIDSSVDLLDKIALYMLHNQDENLLLLEHQFETTKLKLSELLFLSHAFCNDCCELYTQCCVNDWEKINPELYDSEIQFFAKILALYGDSIIIDVEPYNFEERDETPTHVLLPKEKLRQLYTLVLDQVNDSVYNINDEDDSVNDTIQDS